jgi:hypothetical protein
MPPRNTTKLTTLAGRASEVTSLSKKKTNSKFATRKSSTDSRVSAVGSIISQIQASTLRRDFNLVRLILLEAEQSGVHAFSFAGYERDMVQSHLGLLVDVGLLRGTIMRESGGSTHVLVDRLTWAGHDLLALVRDDKRWQKARADILDAHGRAHADVLVQWLKTH